MRQMFLLSYRKTEKRGIVLCIHVDAESGETKGTGPVTWLLTPGCFAWQSPGYLGLQALLRQIISSLWAPKARLG